MPCKAQTERTVYLSAWLYRLADGCVPATNLMRIAHDTTSRQRELHKLDMSVVLTCALAAGLATNYSWE